MNKKEYRSLVDVTAISEENEQIVEGYAAVFETPTVLYTYDDIEYKEIIDRHAFDDADLTDVPFKYNHDDGSLVLARTRNKSLELSIDEHGLKVRANLSKTTAGTDMYESIKSGLIDKMSFAFTVKESSYDTKTHTRRIVRIDKVYDVSAVDLPAYEGTELQARSAEFFKEKIKEIQEKEARRKRLMLLSEL